MLSRSLIIKMNEVAEESNAYSKLTEYMKKNYMSVAFMTAEKTANSVEVSQGTVSRYCVALGYRGFSDFVRKLQSTISEELTAPRRLQMSSDKKSMKSFELIMQESENIRELVNVIRTPEYAKFIDAVAEDKKIVIMSARMSLTLVSYAQYMLEKMRDQIEVAYPVNSTWRNLYLQNPEDVNILLIGFPRYPNILVNKAKELYTGGYHIFSITDSLSSPFVKYSRSTVEIPVTVASIFDLYSAPMAFINIMLRDASSKIPGLQKRLQQIEEHDNREKVYYKTEE